MLNNERSMFNNVADTLLNSGELDDEDNLLYSNETIAKFIKFVLLDNKLRIRVSGKFILDFSGYYVRAISGDDLDDDTYMPNPHLFYYSCMGENERQVVQALSQHDFEGASIFCIASAACVNFNDPYVMARWLAAMFTERWSTKNYQTYKYFEAPSGELLNVEEAIEYMEKEIANA